MTYQRRSEIMEEIKAKVPFNKAMTSAEIHATLGKFSSRGVSRALLNMVKQNEMNIYNNFRTDMRKVYFIRVQTGVVSNGIAA